MDKIVEKFKALGDNTRFKIFIILSEYSICVRGLARKLEVSESAVSQHLKILKNAGLVYGEKIGHFTHYRVNTDILSGLQEIINTMASEEPELESIKAQIGLEDEKHPEGCKETD